MNKLYVVLALLPLLLLQACGDSNPESHYVQAELDAWVHYGNEAERQTIQQQVMRFNEVQDKVRINAVILPEGVYHEQIEMAASQGQLPDIIELDPAYIAYSAWHGQLQPIDKLLPDSIRNDLLPPLISQNMYQGRLYALSPGSQVLILYCRRSFLEAAGINLSTSEAWSDAGPMATIGRLLKDLGRVSPANTRHGLIELHMDRGETWLDKALLPLLSIKEDTLNGHSPFIEALAPQSIQRLEQLQDWFVSGYIDNRDDDSFLNGQVPLAWATQEEFDRYQRAWKDDLLVLPLLDHGGIQDSWSWGISRRCRDRRSAMRFIEFLLQPEEILMMTDASITVPASRSALQMSNRFLSGTEIFVGNTGWQHDTLLLTASPAYPQLRSRFYQLIQKISQGLLSDEMVNSTRADMLLMLEQYQ